MIVLDETEEPKATSEPILYWRSYADGPGASIPRYVERHAERLRAVFIAFAHDVGQSVVAGRRVVEHLDLGQGFSYWWMTRLAEKSPFKSGRIFDCLRMLALEEMLLERKPARLTLRSEDRALAAALRGLCARLGIAFAWTRRAPRRPGWSLRRIYEGLPHAVQGLISFRHVILRRPFRTLRDVRWFAGPDDVFFCSAFFNLDWRACAEGRFHARQWEALPGWLRDAGRRTNWLHHYLPDAGMPDVRTSLAWVRRLNDDAANQGCHAFLETFASPRIVGRALATWLRVVAASRRLRGVERNFAPAGYNVSLWPLLADDWRNSLRGTAAVSNCLWIELFDAALAALPRQARGLYPWENQAWECALVRAWRRNGHGELIGVPHSTMPFWYLNIYDDARDVAGAVPCAKPLPDRLAVNGPMAWKALTGAGFPPRRLVEVEALRFQYLGAYAAARGTRPAAGFARKVLIIGDFTRAQTLKMLACMHRASQMMGPGMSFTLKPHPVCPISPADFDELAFETTDQPLGSIVGDFDFAFSGNSTSAGLDALLAGLPVAVFLDDDDFNHSPLRGEPRVTFVSTPAELAAAVAAAGGSVRAPRVEDYFRLDERLPLWRNLLSEPPGATIGT